VLQLGHAAPFRGGVGLFDHNTQFAPPIIHNMTPAATQAAQIRRRKCKDLIIDYPSRDLYCSYVQILQGSRSDRCKTAKEPHRKPKTLPEILKSTQKSENPPEMSEKLKSTQKNRNLPTEKSKTKYFTTHRNIEKLNIRLYLRISYKH